MCAPCVEKQQSPDHRRRDRYLYDWSDAYFHGNMLVSSEASGRDGHWGCVNMYIPVYNCQHADFTEEPETPARGDQTRLYCLVSTDLEPKED